MSNLTLLNNQDLKIIFLEIPTPFPVGSVNLYLLLGEKITLVDTGPKTELAWKSFIYQLNKHGLRIKDIDQVIITHHHVDHSGLLSVILQHHPNIKILAHEASVPWIEKRDELDKMINFYKELYLENGLSMDELIGVKKYYEYFNKYTDPAKVDVKVSDGDQLSGNNDWTIIHNPGHSQGHISLYHEDSKTLIAGDHLIEHTSSGIFIEPCYSNSGKRPKILVDYKQSLERIVKMDITQVLSGHGNVINEPVEIVNQRLDRLEYRLNKIKQHLTTEPLTVYDIIKIVYPERFEAQLPLYFSEVLGALELLEEQNEVVSTRDGNLIKYKLKRF